MHLDDIIQMDDITASSTAAVKNWVVHVSPGNPCCYKPWVDTHTYVMQKRHLIIGHKASGLFVMVEFHDSLECMYTCNNLLVQ